MATIIFVSGSVVRLTWQKFETFDCIVILLPLSSYYRVMDSDPLGLSISTRPSVSLATDPSSHEEIGFSSIFWSIENELSRFRAVEFAGKPRGIVVFTSRKT